MTEPICAADEWSRQHFSGIRLGDKRLEKRVVSIAEAMARKPGSSCPELFPRWSDLKGAYRLFDNPKVTPEGVQGNHRRNVQEEIKEPGQTVLLIEDTTELEWSGQDAVEGLGPVGKGREGCQGFMLHSTLCARWSWQGGKNEREESKRPPLEIIGLAEQEFYVRKPRPPAEKGRKDSRARKSRERESQLWERTGEHLGHVPEGVRWVRICDRGADIYEFLASCIELGHGFVVRAAQNRVLKRWQTGEKGWVFDTARQAPPIGEIEFEVRSRKGQRSRRAQLSVGIVVVDLQAPYRPNQPRGSLAPIPCTIIHVVETNPPPDVKEPIEWFLLCDEILETWEKTLECVIQYTARWLIEDYHKSLKSGMGAEKLQLDKADRLFAAIAIMSVVALRIVSLREWVRLVPQASAICSGLSSVELQVLELAIRKSLHTVRDVSLAIGHLGGHLGRKNDPEPGFLVLWRGMKHLELLVRGYLLAQGKSAYG